MTGLQTESQRAVDGRRTGQRYFVHDDKGHDGKGHDGKGWLLFDAITYFSSNHGAGNMSVAVSTCYMGSVVRSCRRVTRQQIVSRIPPREAAVTSLPCRIMGRDLNRAFRIWTS